jgi:predicted RNase H-like HicB family nuclease
MTMKFLVTVEWDEEAQVYVATSDDVPGLVAEAPSLDAIKDKVLALVPELLKENAQHIRRSQDDSGDDLVRICVDSSVISQSALTHCRVGITTSSLSN